MDDLTYFEVGDAEPTDHQRAFLAALRNRLNNDYRPYCAELTPHSLLLMLDVDAPNVALVSVGLELREQELQGDRISIHDRTFPPTPTPDGFLMQGTPEELASRGAQLLKRYWERPVVRHEWLHRRRIYAHCYLFEDTGERLVQMYRSDWAPRGQEARLVATGFVFGQGWIQTDGLGTPDRVVHVRGAASAACARPGALQRAAMVLRRSHRTKLPPNREHS